MDDNYSARGFFQRRFSHIAGELFDASVLFPLANVFNFSQGNDPLATNLAVANLAYSLIFISTTSALKARPGAVSQATPPNRTDGQPAARKGPIADAFRLVGRELANPLRITSYCALAIGAVLLAKAHGGSPEALFPGLAGIFFGVGNFLQSSEKLRRLQANPATPPLARAVLHPAVWYGLGYTMTGIGIGGGPQLLANPAGNMAAALLTGIGVVETAGALGMMASGRVTNPAAAFMGVALGTGFFTATGLVTGNLAGAATGACAALGEISLAVKTYTQSKPESQIEAFLTAPLRAAARRGWMAPAPQKNSLI